MSIEMPWRQAGPYSEVPRPDVTIVMPCLNEIVSLPHCIANAKQALALLGAHFNLTGEILIADNGSTDGSQQIAIEMGARVEAVPVKGYGAALIGGCEAAAGRFLLMGDADGSYDFTEGVAMIGELMNGAELCMGSRFKGGIAPGAMPWKNRYIGNPVLTGILNLFFRSGVSDAHCGLRAITKDAFHRLRLSGTGMEFASEMVIKASLKKMRITEAPATLSHDLRSRSPHLRPWRDGWRHLRYLLMLSPTWVFGVPALAGMAIATVILTMALLHLIGILPGSGFFGTSWTIASGFLFTTAHFAAIMAVACHMHAAKEGYKALDPIFRRNAELFTLERFLLFGLVLLAGGIMGLGGIGYYWSQSSFSALPNTLPLVLAAMLCAVGSQTVMGGFVCAIIAGHNARFADERQASTALPWGAPQLSAAAR